MDLELMPGWSGTLPALLTSSPPSGLGAGVHRSSLLGSLWELGEVCCGPAKPRLRTPGASSLPHYLLQLSLHPVCNLIKQAEQLVSGSLACQRQSMNISSQQAITSATGTKWNWEG